MTSFEWKDAEIVKPIRPRFGCQKFTNLMAVGDRILTASNDYFSVMDNELNQFENISNGWSKRKISCAVANDQYVVVGDKRGRVFYHMLEDPEMLSVQYQHKKQSSVKLISVYGALVASAQNSEICVSEMSTEKELWRREETGNVTCLLINNDLIISAHSDKTICIRDALKGELLEKLEHAAPCGNFDMSPDGTMLAVAHDKGVTVWSNRTTPMKKIDDYDLERVYDVRFQTDDKIIAVTGRRQDHQLHLITRN